MCISWFHSFVSVFFASDLDQKIEKYIKIYDDYNHHMLLAKICKPYANRFLQNATRFTGCTRNQNRRCFNIVSDKIINKGLQMIMYSRVYMPMVAVAGTGVGTCIGSYHGYQESKKDTYPEFIFTTICFGWLGGSVGYILSLCFPVTVPIVIVVTIARQMEPVQEPEKKESDIYTLYEKRPT